LRQAYDYWQDQPGNEKEKEKKTRRKKERKTQGGDIPPFLSLPFLLFFSSLSPFFPYLGFGN